MSPPGPITVGGVIYAHAVDNAIDVRQPDGGWRRALILHYDPVEGSPGYLVVYPDDASRVAVSVLEPETRARGIRETVFQLRCKAEIWLWSLGIWLVGRKGAK